MMLLATGLSGTIGRKISCEVKPSKVTLGKDRLDNFLEPGQQKITLIHLGGIVGESNVSSNLIYSHKINVDATLELAREVIEVFGGRFVHISSSHVYGTSNSALKENDMCNPITNYGHQKMLAEQKLFSHFGEDHPGLVILRVFSVLGWDVADFTLGGAAKRILNGSKETIKHSDDVRDFMTPGTVATAVTAIAKDQRISGLYNLSTGIGTSVGDAVRSLFMAKNFNVDVGQIVPGFSQTPYIVGDNSKITRAGLNSKLLWDPTED